MVKKIFLLLIIIFSSIPALAQQINAVASTDTSDYLIGDQIRYSLVITMDKDVYIINPFFRDSLKNIDVLGITGPTAEEKDNKKLVKYLCVLSRFDSASVTIPSIRVEYRSKNDTTLKVVLSNPVSFNVHRMDVNVQQEIKDIKPPVRLFDYMFLIYILAGAFLISVLLYYFVYTKYFKKKKEELVVQKEIKLLSHQLALNKLDELDKEQLWQKGFVKDYHSKITDIIREYFEKQFGLPALERTTTESLNLLSMHPQGRKVTGITSEFLNNADLVKFAKFTPLESVNIEMMTQAKSIVKQTALLDREETIPENENV